MSNTNDADEIVQLVRGFMGKRSAPMSDESGYDRRRVLGLAAMGMTAARLGLASPGPTGAPARPTSSRLSGRNAARRWSP